MSHSKKTHIRKKVMTKPKHAVKRLTRNRKPPVKNGEGKWVSAYEASGDDRTELTQAEERLMEQQEEGWDPRD